MKWFKVVAAILVIAASGSLGNIVWAAEGSYDSELGFAILTDQAFERAERRLAGVEHIVKLMESTQVPGPAPPGAGPCAMGGCIAYKNENGVLRILSPTEVQIIAGLAADANAMTAMGGALIVAQGQFNDGLKAEMRAVSPGLGLLAEGLSQGNIGGASVDPYANPFQMLGFGGSFVLAGATALDDAAQSIVDGEDMAHAQQAARREMLESGRHNGIVDFYGAPAHEFVVEEINRTVEVEGGDTFTMNTAHIYMNVAELVVVKNRIDGTARQGGREVPFYIENESRDFQYVPGTDLYEPYETVTRMGGMLDEEQMAEMAEARVQMEEFEEQMASMPPDQRAMVEQMMGGQLDMMRNLVNTGTFETSQKVAEIYVNPDLNALYSANVAATAAAASPQQPAGGNLVARIQTDLHTLGYDPGNVNGELTTPTVIAISQYQSEKGLEVTGEATESLASVLAAELGR